MIPSPCGLDVCAFVQKSECSSDSTSPKVLVTSDSKIDIFRDDVFLKTFKYDNICSQDSRADVLESIAKSITKDVVESINRVIFVYNLYEKDVAHAIDMMTFCSFVLNNMCATVNSEKHHDHSLHVSCLEVDNDGIVDLMKKTYIASSDLKVFELANKTGSNLIERIVTNVEDVDKIVEVVFQKTIPNSCLDCHHTVLLSTLIVKTRNFDGFEIMKTGRFILVDIGVCIHFLKEVANYICSRRESFYSIPDASSVAKDLEFRNCSLSGLLKNFLSKSKISLLITLSSTLFDMEHMHALEIISELQNLRLKPETNQKLILRESLKDYADEIIALERDLFVLKNNNGILINQQKYRSLKNRRLLSETQLRDMHEERKALSDNLNNKKESLTRLQKEIKLISIKIEEERQKLKFSKVPLEETEQKKIALNQKKMEKVDACASINNLINFNITSMKNQNFQLAKIKHAYEKSSSNVRLLNEEMNSFVSHTTTEQNKLKDKIESLLLLLKDILLNSTTQQKNFIVIISEFHCKFEEILKLWKQHSTNLITDFHSFLGRVLNNSLSLKNNLCAEFVSLNFSEGAIIEVIKKNKAETLHMITSCSTNIQVSVENSIKLLYEFLYFLEIIQGKVKEELKKLESTICCHSNDRMKFLSSTNSTMASMHQYFNVHLDLSSKINSDIFSHHQDMKQCVNQEFTKMKEALNSIKKLFCMQQTFVTEKWQQKQTYLSNVKEIGGVSESLQLCTEEHPILLDKLRQQCVSSIDELYSILRDQTVTVENQGSQLKQLFNEIECSIKDCSEENKKRINQQEIDTRNNLEIQNEKIRKFMETTRSQVEDIGQSITGGLQNIKNSFFNVKDLKKSNDVNHFIIELKNNLDDYIRNYANILKLSELTLQQLPETVPKQTENLEESLVFNLEELLSSTPISSHQRSKNTIDDKTKFLNRLKKIASVEINYGCQNNLSLDQESIINASIISLPSMSTRTKVEILNNRSLGHRRVAK